MKKLGQVDICGIPHEVVERTVEEDPNLADCYGYFQPTIAMIVMRANLPGHVFTNTLFHEGQHGIWEHSGVGELKQDSDNYQEAFIQVYTPHLLAFTKSVKRLKVA